MAVLIQKERSNRWLNLSVGLILIVLIAIELSTYFKPDTAAAREESRVAETVEAWLADQKQGGDGLRFWASHEAVELVQFHCVRSWKTVHIEPFDHALVRVDSLTEKGEPVSKLWKIYLGIERNGDRLITRIVDAADGSMPPAVLASRQESPLSREARRENEEAGKKLEELTRKVRDLEVENERKVHELEVENQRKLSRLGDSLDRAKQETDRRIEEQVGWIQRMADQNEKTKRELAAAKAQAGLSGNADPRSRFAGVTISGVGGVTILAMTIDGKRFVVAHATPGLRISGSDGVPQPPLRSRSAMRPVGLRGPAPRPDETEIESFFKREKAEDSYRGGNYKAAADIYTDLIASRPRARSAYLRRGDCYASLHDFDRAIDDFGTAIRLMPSDPRARLARSWAYLGKGEPEQALSDAAEALRLDPTLAEAHLIQAEVFARKGVPDRAAAARSDAMAAFYRRGVASIIKHDYGAGIADLQRVIREAPDRAEAHAWSGKARYLRSDFPGAIKDFDRVIALRPADKQGYNDRGMAYFHTRAYDAAIADLDRAIGLDPKFDEAYLNRGTVRLVVGDVERAASDFSIVIQLIPRKAAAYQLRSVAYDRMGWAQKAASDLRVAQSLSR